MFENIDVYQKSVEFTDQVVGLTQDFPRGYWFLADQLNRASLSITTNLAEGSVQECVPLLIDKAFSCS